MKKRVAIPLENGILCSHFGHCQQFAIVDVENNKIVSTDLVTPPPHEPGLLPKWLGERGVTNIIAGGIGERAINLFKGQNIEVLAGAAPADNETLVNNWINGTLVSGKNSCDH